MGCRMARKGRRGPSGSADLVMPFVVAVVFHQLIFASCFVATAFKGDNLVRIGRLPTKETAGPLDRRVQSHRMPTSARGPSVRPEPTRSAPTPRLAPQQLGEFEPVGATDAQREARLVRLLDYSAGDPIRFREMWDAQRALVGGHLDRLAAELDARERGRSAEPFASQFLPAEDVLNRGESGNRDELASPADDSAGTAAAAGGGPAGDGRDCVVMLQHAPVYTLGTGSDPGFIKSSASGSRGGGKAPDVDVVRTERGGEVTYHGPGQLVVYPILDLRGYRMDIHWYMRALEEAILMALETAGVEGAAREDDVTGVWVSNRKVAALGIKARRWVTMHGIAVNVEPRSLGNFDGIVPCGLVGRDVCCVNDHLEEPITVREFAGHMKEALEHVFEIRLV